MKLKDKTAIVTGASRGIGRAIALKLAAEGAAVVVHYGTQRGAADTVVKEIAAAGGKAFALGADTGNVAAIREFWKQLDAELPRRFGRARIDILVNNAGIAPMATLDKLTEELLDRVLAVNLKGPMFMAQEAESRLNDGGRIVNLSSLTSRKAYPFYAAYAPTKGALNTLTRLLAQHFGPRGITVNAVSPGATDTDINAEWLRNPEAQQMVAGQVALGRVGQAADIAPIVAALCLPENQWVTGQYIEANGGQAL